MVHAQRLLPLEQLLSEAAATPGAVGLSSPAKPVALPDARRSEPSAAGSPFAADSARKSKLSAEPTPLPQPRPPAATTTAPVVMGAAAPAAIAPVPPDAEATEEPSPDSSDLRQGILDALESAGNRMLSSLLETGAWRFEGSELTIQVPASAKVIEMSLSAEAKRLIVGAAVRTTGRSLTLKVVPGESVRPLTSGRPSSNGGGGRSRVEQNPIVQRMKEKFGAEIRTVIDYREKR